MFQLLLKSQSIYTPCHATLLNMDLGGPRLLEEQTVSSQLVKMAGLHCEDGRTQNGRLKGPLGPFSGYPGFVQITARLMVKDGKVLVHRKGFLGKSKVYSMRWGFSVRPLPLPLNLSAHTEH